MIHFTVHETSSRCDPPEDAAVGVIEGLVWGHDPVQELGCERQCGYRLQQPTVSGLSSLYVKASRTFSDKLGARADLLLNQLNWH